VVIGLALFGVRSTGALIAFGLCTFTAFAIGGEFARGSRLYRSREKMGWPSALGRTLARNRRRYGGYIVHLGVVLIVIGLAGGAFKTERQAHIGVGDSIAVGDYELVYEHFSQGEDPEKSIFTADIGVFRDGERVTTLTPQRNFHSAQQQWQSEIAIRSNPIEDLYVVVTAFDPDQAASVRAFVNPLTWWIWAGAAVMVLGMSVILSGLSPVTVRARARAKLREQVAAAR
jgi:cytochrome c-type biogenesis protein CcmF